MFSGCGHGQLRREISTGTAILHLLSARGSRTYKGPRRASLVKSAVLFWPDDVHGSRQERFHLVGAWFCAMRLSGLGILGRMAVFGVTRSCLFRFRERPSTRSKKSDNGAGTFLSPSSPSSPFFFRKGAGMPPLLFSAASRACLAAGLVTGCF